MSYRAFLEEVKKALPSQNYLLAASDPFLLADAISHIGGLVAPEEKDFNLHRFDLLNQNGTGLDQVIDILNTMPFFSGRKFVVIENSQKLLKKDLKKLGVYLQNPSETSVLVLLNQGTPKKELKDELGGLKYISLDISEREIGPWLKSKARAKGFELADGAADYLLGTIGPDLGLLSSELEKCMLVGKQLVEREDIMEIVEGKRKYSAFALVDAIRARDAALAFKIYRILRETEEPYSLLGALNWQYARSFQGKNSPAEREYYAEVFGLLNRADVEIKSSGGPYPMEFLLAKLLRLSRAR